MFTAPAPASLSGAYGTFTFVAATGAWTYTLNNAYASFQERELGSLTPGKYADVVVMSKDIMSIPEQEIPSARADYTIVGGQVRYRRESTP